MKKLVQIMVAAGMVGGSAAAMADEHTLTGNVGFASDYRFRGISQTYKEPAIQGGFDYSHASGAYLGTWASNVDSNLLAGSNLEWDIYGGYSHNFGDVNVNVGGLYYYYPGKDKAAYAVPGVFTGDPNTFEVYAGATWKWFNLKYSHTTTELFGINDSKGSGYLEFNATYSLPYDITLGAHVAKQYVSGSTLGVSNTDYMDWKLSVTKPILGFNVSLAYVDTDISKCPSDPTWCAYRSVSLGSKTKDLANGTAVLYIGKTF